jgi:hypothetical protein
LADPKPTRVGKIVILQPRKLKLDNPKLSV